MPKPDFISVEAYLASLSPAEREAIASLRAIIRAAVPKATEAIRYKMPYYEYKGAALCALASQKNYLSFYVMHPRVVEQNKALLKGLDVGKGCIRFRKLSDLPESTVRKLVLESAAENESGVDVDC